MRNVINAMNREFLSQLEGEAPAIRSSASNLYLDVNGDKKVTAGDALMVINYMNTRALMAAAEAANGELIVSDVLPKSRSNTLSSAQLSDSAIATLTGEESKIATNAVQQSAIVHASNSTSGSSVNDEDDEDDILSLLADDVASVWS
jgi:large repetitive protein